MNEQTPATNYPKCKRKTTRKKCFDLLIELCKDNEENRINLTDILIQYCQDLQSK